MQTLATYSVEEMLPLLGFGKPKIRFQLPNGQTVKVKVSSHRLECLRLNQAYVWCGKVGNTFMLQKVASKPEAPHINLYHLSSDGKMLLMTQDHIIPKSRGGADHVDNLATMCEKCNGKKGGLLPLGFVLRMTGWQKFHLLSQKKQDQISRTDHDSQAKELSTGTDCASSLQVNPA